MTIAKNINNISKSDRILFTTPSHDRGAFVFPKCNDFFGKKYFSFDLSEINGLDNLSDPQYSILKSMQKSAEMIGADRMFYLVNGSSSGIVASMTAVLKDGDKVLVAENCHKSVLNGLILSGAEPVWLTSDINIEWDIFNPVSPQKISEAITNTPNIKAVIITSPTYEGVTSDIKTIAEICHKNNCLLIVDEAHGALKSFAPKYFGDNAVKLGADISVQSLHKTCGAPNPCAIMLCGKNVQNVDFQSALNLINTTSPSFPIIAACEITVNYLFSAQGQTVIEKFVNNLLNFKNTFSKNQNIKICDFNDVSKILVKINGLSGFELSDILFEKFSIEDEIANNRACMLLTGIGTKKSKLAKLKKALSKIIQTEYTSSGSSVSLPFIKRNAVLSPRTAFFEKHKTISVEDSFGKICAEIISEYPPGIPVLIPGEQILEEHIRFLKIKNISFIKVVDEN